MASKFLKTEARIMIVAAEGTRRHRMGNPRQLFPFSAKEWGETPLKLRPGAERRVYPGERGGAQAEGTVCVKNQGRENTMGVGPGVGCRRP